ncbi:unnamed protein product [Acanthoscelides obtectus]|uniref:Myosin motor domain-containing protein n=1 Tax=Acanthoscelides obtectus TaxID=200917 RepID=A0A9P0M1H1_ACAOB|nr:unnamed protein product [Acanthoscelides obtectus]CAK1664631.1 Unconventional myosin-XVIIIa [Acanthoscelides obtectus]
MLHISSTFENSLRRDVTSSPVSKKHTSCKGTAHGTGNYAPKPDKECDLVHSPFQRTDSKRWSKRNKKSGENENEEPFQRTSSGRWSGRSAKGKPDSKTASVSSEFSESDSLDSVGDKTKSSDTIDDGLKKLDDVSSRLFKNVTKSSIAKTAKMRHLDIFDVDDNTWMGGLRKSTAVEDLSKQKPPADLESPFCRSRNNSYRRKSTDSNTTENGNSKPPSGHQENGFARSKNGSVKKKNELVNGFGARNSFKRTSFNKKLTKIKAIPYDEILFMSNIRKTAGFFSIADKNNCFKDFGELVDKKENGEAKSEEHLANEKLWLESEKLWLMHRGGFTAAYKETENSQEPGKLKIRLETTGDVLSVDEDDIEKANPPQFDRAEDLASLRHLNESSILHTLRQRYASNLIHTYAGSGTLLVINPMAPLAIYSEKVVSLFKGCKSEDMPPHIYSMAQASYHSMVSTRRDQSLVFIGRSGSGKTTNFRHCVQYLVTAAGANNKVLTPEKLTALWFLLESFGNCKTVMNTNGTRFTQIFSLDFDQAGVIASASLQIFMLEKTRAVRKIDGETTFHMMYRMLCGVEGHLRKELFLDNLSGNENNQFMTYLQKHEDKQRAQMEFAKVCTSMNVLGISESEQKVIFSVLAAIFHLGCAGVAKVPSSGPAGNRPAQFASPAAAQRAAHLLGTTAEELARSVFSAGPRTPPSPTPGTDHHHYSHRNGAGATLDAAPDALEAFAAALYAELVNCVAHLINRSLASPTYTVSSILLVDTPGFQNPATCGRQVGASFEDLCHNYLQERLQLLFHHTNLVAPRDRYLQENIDIVYDENETETLINPTPLVNLLDKQAQNTVIRTSQMDLHEADRRGLLWLLDEEAIYPGSSDESFIERLFTHYGDRDHQLLIRKAPGNNQFIIQHLQGTNPVLYCAKGWLKYSRENPVSRTAIAILQESSKEEISNLFVSVRGLGASSFSGSLVGIEGSQSLRRASSIRRTFTAGTAAMKRKSICLQVKFTIDGLIETLRRTKLRFVQCLLPQHNAGLCEANAPLIAAKTSSGQHEDNLINVPLLRSQIRGAQILDAVRLYKQGFPNFMPLGEFRRRFHLLAGDYKVTSPVLDERKAVEDMLLALDLEPSSYRVGLSQVSYEIIV